MRVWIGKWGIIEEEKECMTQKEKGRNRKVPILKMLEEEYFSKKKNSEPNLDISY